MPSAGGRLVLFTGELPLMVLKHVEISPCLRLLSVARGSCLIDLVFGVFVQNYGAGLSCKILFRYFHEFVKHK